MINKSQHLLKNKDLIELDDALIFGRPKIKLWKLLVEIVQSNNKILHKIQ